MKRECKQPRGTRERILEAATEVFAAKGFRSATVGEICRKARANIAAVNYHFGSKAALYREAWRHAHQAMLKAFPPDGGVSPDAPPAKRLRGRIRSMLQRAISAEGLEFRIMAHEVANPTGLLGQVFQDNIRPLTQATADIVAELLGGRADDLAVRLCATSVIGPCMQVLHRQRMHAQEGMKPWFGEDLLETLVDHFTTFALAGIREVRRQIEEQARGRPGRPDGAAATDMKAGIP
jgi:AcrR family transcriptional regulator